MKYISLIPVAASALVAGCTVATSERWSRGPHRGLERTVVYTYRCRRRRRTTLVTSDTRCCRCAYAALRPMLL